MSSRKILIAGGGIGGLTAAIALRRSGFDVEVFERAPELRPLGAGIVLAANAMRALARIGAAERVGAVGQPVHALAILEASGRPITSSDFAPVERALGAPTLTFHRAELHEALLSKLGDGVVRLGAEVVSFEQDGEGVRVRLSTGATSHGAALIGADGLHSNVRRQLFGDTPLVYSGQTSWRGVTPPGDFVPKGSNSESWGPGRRFGMVSLKGGRVYWFAVNEEPAGGSDAPGEVRASLLRKYAGWHAPIREVIEATLEPAIVRTDIQDREPLSKWTVGRVTLLGDAAHPMTPNMGQGGCQAIVDAVALGEELAHGDAVSAALARYEARRLARTRAVVLQSRRMGELAHWRNPLARAVRNAGLKAFRHVLASQMRKFMAQDSLPEVPARS